MGQITQEDIIRFNAREQSGFNAIYNALQEELCKCSCKITKDWHESEDIVQKCFLKFYKKYNRIENEKVARAVLYTIVRNESLTYVLSTLRRLRKESALEEPILDDLEQEQYDDTNEIKLTKMYMRLNECLPPQTKRITKLRLQGFKTAEICKILNITKDTVHTHDRIAVTKLRKSLNVELYKCKGIL